ncbi:MAG: GNA1162 family protein [Prolixibacteraceae bacterium]
MNKILLISVLAITLLSACTTTLPITKSVAYKGIYDEKPLTILLMPPINRSTNVEAKEYFHSTLNIPIANAGFYVIPTFLSMEILKKESAYDAELFLDAPLDKFGEVFGADLAVFTIIHKWDKSGIAAKVLVQVEYIIKSVKTNEIVYSRIGDVVYDASVSTGAGGLAGLVADVALSAINTAATKYVDIARVCNAYTFSDLPSGKYSPMYGIDGELPAGNKVFRVSLSSKYR